LNAAALETGHGIGHFGRWIVDSVVGGNFASILPPELDAHHTVEDAEARKYALVTNAASGKSSQ